MPPVPSKPAPSAPTPTHSLKFGLGFQLTLGTHTVKVEPEPTELDALREGTFKYALPDGTDLDVGSLADAWKDLRDFAPALPELPEMTGALNDVENVAITVRDL